MLSRDIDDFGGVRVDAKPISNPQTQVSAASLNRLLEDVAQMTRTATRAIIHFSPVPSGDPTISYFTSVWGSGSEQTPDAERTGTGVYVFTFDTSFTDSLGESEDVSFLSGVTGTIGETTGRAEILSLADNVVTIGILDDTDMASDLTGAETIVVWLR